MHAIGGTPPLTHKGFVPRARPESGEEKVFTGWLPRQVTPGAYYASGEIVVVTGRHGPRAITESGMRSTRSGTATGSCHTTVGLDFVP